MIKCYGEFLCSQCGTITKEKFEVEPDQLDYLYIVCKCGKHVEQYIPVDMRDIILSLASKGYKVRMIIPKTLGIVLNEKLPITNKEYPPLPFEFSYDTTEPEGDIICNERLQFDDFDGIDKDKYIKEAKENLLDWTSQLPFIKHGEYIDRTQLTLEEMNHDKNGSV